MQTRCSTLHRGDQDAQGLRAGRRFERDRRDSENCERRRARFMSRAMLAAVDGQDYADELEVEFAQTEPRRPSSRESGARPQGNPLPGGTRRKQQFDDVARGSPSPMRRSGAQGGPGHREGALCQDADPGAHGRLGQREEDISQGNTSATGPPLYSLVQIDPLKLLFTVSEKDIGRLKVGQDVDSGWMPTPTGNLRGRSRSSTP